MLLETAIAAAQAAGAILKKNFGKTVQVNETTAHDLKIQADLDAQALIEQIILDRFPDHKILGEEGNAGNPEGGIEWIVDPLDGTVNYAYGIPHFCVSIAARDAERTLIGVIYDPMRDELFTATHVGPARLNGVDITCSKRSQLSECIFVIGFSKSAEALKRGLELYQHYLPQIKKVRNMGSAALDLAYVAAGRLDCYIESNIQLWDVAAGNLLVAQAGGSIKLEQNPSAQSYRTTVTNGRLDLPLP
jgi:myo-inositol-1(or 4)-monophosphatase